MKKFFMLSDMVDLTDIAGTLASVQRYIEHMEIETERMVDVINGAGVPEPAEINIPVKYPSLVNVKTVLDQNTIDLEYYKNVCSVQKKVIQDQQNQATADKATITTQKTDIENLTAWNERLEETLKKYKPIGE